MKKILVGLAVGVGVGLLLKKMNDEGLLTEVCDDLSRVKSKVARNLKNVADVGMNEAEYIKDRVEAGIEKGKEKLDSLKG